MPEIRRRGSFWGVGGRRCWPHKGLEAILGLGRESAKDERASAHCSWWNSKMVQASESHIDDALLRDAILSGDRQAAEGLFRRQLEPLYEFVHYRVGRDRAMAEDVVQDTFLAAFEGLSRFDARSSLHTWLCGIARNKIREQRRKLKPVPIADVLEAADGDIDSILEGIDREPLPDWVIEHEETAELVGATLSSLPPDYREALVAKYVDGLSVAEIGSRGGKSEKAAESTLTRARLAFSRVFQLLAVKRGEVE
ncbi:MAG: RNA polymerase sigma-70 factor (ECF subfamily) [Planctomycetota bacterium]|jgi:RNA polymerase sigma-70 factor (ECF subfamily)